MQSYYIYYPPIYPSYASQRPISDNLVKKDIDCSKECEKDMRPDSKYLKPRWCPPDLSHTQKKKITTFAQEGVHGTTIRGCTSKASDHEAGMEA